MNRREVVRLVLDGQKPPYVPWAYRFTKEAADRLTDHYGTDDLLTATGGHVVELGSDIGFFDDLGNDQVRDVFGVQWDRSIDKDIGIVCNQVMPEPTLEGYEFPDPLDRRFFKVNKICKKDVLSFLWRWTVRWWGCCRWPIEFAETLGTLYPTSKTGCSGWRWFPGTISRRPVAWRGPWNWNISRQKSSPIKSKLSWNHIEGPASRWRWSGMG